MSMSLSICMDVPFVLTFPSAVTHLAAAWPLVASESLVANHYYMRSGLVRKAELHTTLEPFEHGFCPEAYVATISSEQDRDSFIDRAGSLAKRGGIWVVKRGDSSNARDMLVFGADEKLRESANRGVAVDDFCSSAAASGEARVRELLEKLPADEKRPWIIQKYIERPLLINRKKFHLRATVLAVGRLKVYLHTQMMALTASKPYNTSDLDDITSHASNHSVQDRFGNVHTCESCLLKELHEKVGNVPAIRKDACRLLGDRPTSIYVSGYGWHHTASDPFTQQVASFDKEEFGTSWSSDVWGEVLRIVRVIFHAATHSIDKTKQNKQGRIFFPLSSCFELFGVDIMLDTDGRVWLLEVNCDPDFSVFGDQHRDVAQRIMDDALSLAIDPMFPPGNPKPESGNGFKLAFELLSKAGQSKQDETDGQTEQRS